MEHSTEVQNNYERLQDYQQDIVKILALIDKPEAKTKIMQICNKAGIRNNTGKSFNSVTIGDELDEIKSSWLIRKTINSSYGQQYEIAPDAFDFVMRKGMKDPRLSFFREAVLEFIPVKGYSFAPLKAEILRELSFAIYSNNSSLFERMLEYTKFHHDFSLNAVYKALFVDRLGVQNIPNLNPKIQLAFYRINLEHLLLTLEDATELLNSVKILAPQLKDGDLEFVQNCISLEAVLKGDWASVIKTWNGNDSDIALKYMAWVHFAQGHNNKALIYFDEALKKYQKKFHKKSYFLDYAGNIYFLTLLKEDNIKNLISIKASLKNLANYGATYGLLIFSALVDNLQNDKTKAEELFGKEFMFYSLDGLLFLYAQYWTQVFSPDWEKYAYTLHHKALKNGYYWVAYNVAALMEKISSDKSEYYRKSFLELRPKVDNVPSWVDIVHIREDWELAIQAIEAIVGNKPATNSSANVQNRLIWLVDFEKQLIQPKVQKMNLNGTWSKGRNVSLSKLAYNEVEEVTPQDARVAQTISRQEQGWYGQHTYGFFNLAKTFKELIGHPLLFLLKSPDVACELKKGNPELIIKEKGDGYEISSSVDISAAGFTIKKETPTRYQLIEITPEQVQLFQAIGKNKIVIPQKGKEKLEKVLSNIATIIPIQTDLMYHNEDLPAVEADPRIYVHLLPVGEGFHVELFVKPFQICPPYYKPGEGTTRSITAVEGVNTQTQRNLKAENAATQALIEACPTLQIKAQKDVWELDNPLDCLELLRELEPLKLTNSIVVEWPKGEKIKIKQYLGFDNLKISIKKENDWFGISGKVYVNENLVLDLQQLLNMLQDQNSEFIQLDDGQFLALSKQLKKQLSNIQKFSDDNGKIHPLAGFALDGLSMQIKDLEIDSAWEKHINKLRLIEKKEYFIPETLLTDLRPYQKEGFQWLCKLSEWGVGACLADDMGLGKTIQALAVILQRSAEGPTLVVAPASVCRNWVKEIEKFAPSLTPIMFSDAAQRPETLSAAKAHDVIISTYGLLQSEEELFESTRFATIVLDEAQAIKNSSAKRSKSAMKLKGDFKIITTGTPIENHLSELWNLFRFINPGLLGSMDSFRSRFALPIERDNDKETQEQLQLLIRPFILRRHKRDVLKELPEKTEIVLTVNLSEEEQAFYEVLRRQAIDSLASDTQDQAGAKHLKILAQIMRLRQACCNPKLIEPKTLVKSSKLKLFGTIVEELIENGHKALVFSQFVGHLKLIEEHVRKKGIAYQYLDGQTPTKVRQERIDAFQKGEGDLFLISLKAGGTGLNLTAADYVIHMDPWWNPAVEDQASDRAHRIGQQRPVTVYRLITEDTIEEKIIKLHESKRDLADSLLEGTDASSKLSADDLLELIKNQ